MRRVLILSSACCVLAACSTTPPVECRTGADCASGVCNRDGTCEPGVGLPLPDGGLEDSGVLEPVDGGHDAGTSETDAGQPDAWARLSGRYFKIEAEGAVLFAEVEQPSLIPGVLLRDRVRSFQGGGSLESTIGAADAVFVGGVNLGFASGDPAPGFGAYPYGTEPTAGELDGPQLDIPRDRRIDNFRFHPDYRIDRVLFAEIIGTATDVMYLRPWTRTRLLDFKSSQLNLNVDGTFTHAFYASSTPNNDPNLGMELHASLTWLSKDGFDVLAEYAVLFPFAAFDNPSQGLTARPAQLGRVRLAWKF